MGQPNLVVLKPSSHRIEQQQIDREGDTFIVTLSIRTIRMDGDGLGEVERVVFGIPINICDHLFTVFEVGRNVNVGWILYYKEREQYLETRLVEKTIVGRDQD